MKEKYAKEDFQSQDMVQISINKFFYEIALKFQTRSLANEKYVTIRIFVNTYLTIQLFRQLIIKGVIKFPQWMLSKVRKHHTNRMEIQAYFFV